MATTSTLLSRRQAAALLGRPESEVKARDGEAFHPIKGPDGSWRYLPAEVAAVIRGGAPSAPGLPPAGTTCSEAFSLFQAGKSLTEAVITLKQAPDVVRAIRAQYDAVTTILSLSGEALSCMEKVFGKPIQTEKEFLAALSAFQNRLDAEFVRGYRSGAEDANDFGEVVDSATGQRRRVTRDDATAVLQLASHPRSGAKPSNETPNKS
ncbi:MAG: hypothetical protein ABSF35_19805 [Polyangia bacterium]|jgi:hypothetical protein